MIIDYSKMKEIEDKLGTASVSAPQQVPDLLNTIINDVLDDCKKIEILIEEANQLKKDYKETTDKRAEDNIVNDLTDLNTQINRLFTK